MRLLAVAAEHIILAWLLTARLIALILSLAPVAVGGTIPLDPAPFP